MFFPHNDAALKGKYFLSKDLYFMDYIVYETMFRNPTQSVQQELTKVRGILWKGNFPMKDGLFEAMFPTDSPEGLQNQAQSIPGLYVRLVGPKMFTPHIVAMIEKVLKNVDHVILFCKNQNLAASDLPKTESDIDRNLVNETEENMINLLDRGFVDSQLPELQIAEDLNRGQILRHFKRAYPELANLKKFNIYKSSKFSNFIITLLTDEISEYNHTFLTCINKYQGSSKIFQSTDFWRHKLRRTMSQAIKDSMLPKIYHTSLRTGRIEHRTCPIAVLRHF